MNTSPKPSAEFLREYAELEKKVSALQQQAYRARGSSLSRTVVVACLVLGALCILSTLAKTWFTQTGMLDWGILLVGVVLCAVSLFKEFALTKDGLKVKVADITALVNQIKSLTQLMH
jgi:hypothetical protein